MRVQITELCLTVDDDLAPFAVMVERGEECAWSTLGDLHREDKGWLGHLLTGAERRPEEWWVLDAWRDWLDGVAALVPSERRDTLRRADRSTPGCVVRHSKTAVTRLPAGTVASRWRRDRFFDRAEMIAAEVAATLARGGKAHWNSTLTIEGHEPQRGDWVVEVSPAPGNNQAARGLALVHAIDAHHIPALKETWAALQDALGPRYPYAVAVIRGWRGTEAADGGYLIGERFAAPVSLAVATVRSKW